MTIAFHGVGSSIPQVQVNDHTGSNVSFGQNIFDDLTSSDIVVLTTVPEQKPEQTAKPAAPSISFPRILFNRFTKEQVKEVNESKMLPKNAKFVGNGITVNFIDFTAGTHILPKGYEVKNDRFGFTHVVREGTQSWLFKKETSEK